MPLDFNARHILRYPYVLKLFFLLLADRGRQFRILFRLSYPADKIIVPAS